MSDHLIAINHAPDALADHMEWELLDALPPSSAFSSAELADKMDFTMIYESPPCAPFARPAALKEMIDAA